MRGALVIGESLNQHSMSLEQPLLCHSHSSRLTTTVRSLISFGTTRTQPFICWLSLLSTDPRRFFLSRHFTCTENK
uniref:Uncharacterized protein n=1 Tax=Picea glauca TaxID=3330 RepID=A0A101LWF5_PICGL|nr:hypothetical protein ABT39_MTgene1507 [Picea glauca]